MKRQRRSALRRLFFGLRVGIVAGVQGFRLGLKMFDGIHAEAERQRRATPDHVNCRCILTDRHSDDPLIEAGTRLIRKALDE